MDDEQDDLTLVYMWAYKQAKKEYKDRIEELEAALRTLIASCDSGMSMQKIGVSGMSVQTNIQSSWVHNVEAWAVQEARAALAGEKKHEP